MDQVLPQLLRFDRFVLDLTRGCLRTGDQDIALRPKAFEVLRHLVENAGRLVSKQELFRVVWPNVAVTDDSLVQCIRELRDKLGDTEHRLIKTVPRRGYLLDANSILPGDEDNRPPDSARRDAAPDDKNSTAEARRPPRRRRGTVLAAGLVLAACVVAAAVYALVHVLTSPSPNALFTAGDARRAAAIAGEKQLPLPAFQINAIGRAVSPQHRRFVGIWVSSTGFVNSNRQFMLVITDAASSGVLTGFTVRGPPQVLSLIQNPAGSFHFKARVIDDSFRYSGADSEREVTMLAGHRLQFSEAFDNGAKARVILDPVWTLIDAERKAAERMAASPRP